MLASGFGTRLRPFSNLIPKPFLPLMGVPCIQFTLDSLKEAKIKTVVINTHHLEEVALRQLSELDTTGLDIKISSEKKVILGSGGGIRQAMDLISEERFFVINGDVLCAIDYRQLEKKHELLRNNSNVNFSLALVNPTTNGYYSEVLLDEPSSLIQAIGERKLRARTFCGVGIYERSAFSHLLTGKPWDVVKEVWRPSLEEKKAGAFVSDFLWIDIGSSQLWLEAHFLLKKALESGSLLECQRLRLEKELASIEIKTRGKDTKLVEPCFWNGIGSPGQVGPNAVLYAKSSDRNQYYQNGIGYLKEWKSF